MTGRGRAMAGVVVRLPARSGCPRRVLARSGPVSMTVSGLRSRGPLGSPVMAGFLQVSTAAESRVAAEELARSVVGARLAASAQIIGPVTSVFWHLGELGTGEEWQVLFKTREDRYAVLEAHLLEHHPWRNPEISAVPIVAGSPSYLDWILRTTRASTGD